MAECAHCGKIVGGIKDHIRDKHGFPYYYMLPWFAYAGCTYFPIQRDESGFCIEPKPEQGDV